MAGPETSRDWDDPGNTAEDDLWFLPGPLDDEEPAPPGAPPLPLADRRALFDPAEWLAAQDALSSDLARLAQVFGELDCRLRGAAPGIRQRLALREAADLSWWTGDRLTSERLALWVGLRIGSTEDTEHALARAGWAVRRLSGGQAPVEGLAAFLERPEEDPIQGVITDLAELLASIEPLHPVVQSAVLFHAWRMIGPERARDTEAAVLAARHAAGMSRMHTKPNPEAAAYGIDIGNKVFHVVAMDAAGQPIQRGKFARETLLRFFETADPVLIGMEACAGSQWLARKLIALGHDARIIPAKFVKAYVKSNKSDTIDAEAIAEAVNRPTVPFVQVRSDAQVDLQALHRIRDRLVRNRTGLMNQARAFCIEYGLAMRTGAGGFHSDIRRHLTTEENDLSSAMRTLLASLLDDLVKWSQKTGPYAPADFPTVEAVSSGWRLGDPAQGARQAPEQSDSSCQARLCTQHHQGKLCGFRANTGGGA